MENKMNQRIQDLIKQAGDYVNEVYTPPVRSKTPDKIWEDGHIGWNTLFNEKFAELIAEECARMCMSQADRKNIRSAFGLLVESSVKYKGPEPSNSIESQYNRTLNTTKIE
jgi:hypothetical protein